MPTWLCCGFHVPFFLSQQLQELQIQLKEQEFKKREDELNVREQQLNNREQQLKKREDELAGEEQELKLDKLRIKLKLQRKHSKRQRRGNIYVCLVYPFPYISQVINHTNAHSKAHNHRKSYTSHQLHFYLLVCQFISDHHIPLALCRTSWQDIIVRVTNSTQSHNHLHIHFMHLIISIRQHDHIHHNYDYLTHYHLCSN